MSLIDVLKSLLVLLFLLPGQLRANIQQLLDSGAFEQAEAEIIQQLNQHPSDLEQIELMTLFGDLWFYQHDFEQAMNQYDAALSIAVQLSDVMRQAEQMKNIAITYSERRQYGKALQWHEQAKQLLGEHTINNTSLSILLSQAMIFTQVGATELASETLVSAQKVAFELGNHAGLNNSFLRLAHQHLKKQQYQAAQNQLAKIDLNVLLSMDDLRWYHLLSTEAALQLGQLGHAEFMLNQFNNISEGSGYQNDSAIRTLTVKLKISQNQFDQAAELINDLALNDASETWLIQYLMGQLHQAQNQHIDAFAAYQNAVNLFTESHHKTSNNDVYIQIPKDLLSQTLATALSVGFNDMEQVFDWLTGLYQAEQVQFNSQSYSDEVKHKESASRGYDEVLADVSMGQNQLHRLGLYDLSKLQSALTTDEGMVFMIAVNDQMLALMVDAEKVKLVELVVDVALLKQQISQFINQISINENWLPMAQSIEDSVILPLRAYGLDQYKVLHIIPDETLRFLPFDALMDQQGKWLLDRHTVILHSIHSLAGFLDNRISPKDQFLAQQSSRLSFVGNAVTMAEAPNYWRTAYRNLSFDQQYFLGVEQEHQLIKSLQLNGEIKLNEQATESSAVDLISGETGILHFASHGFDNPVAPAFSALLLSAGGDDDGLLQAREVAKLSSELSLVVLASCSSAKGGLPGRYGFQLGLSEAFLQAGADAVVGTLWDVKDQKTFYFMQWFYAFLASEGQPAKALKLAKQQAISEQWQVADWSAFVILGNGSIDLTLNTVPKAQQPRYDLFFYLLVTVLLLLLMIYTKQQRIKKITMN